MIAVNLLRCLKQRSMNKGGTGEVHEWFPNFDMDGDSVWLHGIDVRSHACFCFARTRYLPLTVQLAKRIIHESICLSFSIQFFCISRTHIPSVRSPQPLTPRHCTPSYLVGYTQLPCYTMSRRSSWLASLHGVQYGPVRSVQHRNDCPTWQCMHHPPLPPQQVSLDAGFRHRSRAAQGASVITSVELKELNEKGRRTAVQNLVSRCRRCSEKVHLGLHCAFARDGERFFLHGTEKEWKSKVAKGGAEKEEALRLNCYSSGAIRFPLAAQTAEGIGAKISCLIALLERFWVEQISHDQDAHIGSIFKKYYSKCKECFDRAHIAVRFEPSLYLLGGVMTLGVADSESICNAFRGGE